MIAQRDKSTPERETILSPSPLLQNHTKGAFIIGGTILLSIALLTFFSWLALTRLPPRTTLGNVRVGLLTPEAAVERFVQEDAVFFTELTLTPDLPEATVSAVITADQLELSYDADAAVARFWQTDASPLSRAARFAQSVFSPARISVSATLNQSVINEVIAGVAAQTDQPGREPSITLKTSGVLSSLSIDAGELGTELDSTASALLVLEHFPAKTWGGGTQVVPQQKPATVRLPVRQSGRVLTTEEQTTLKERAEMLVGKRLIATAERLQLSLNDKQIIGLIDPSKNWNDDAINTVVAEWQKQTGTQPQEPELEFDSATQKVTKFTPARNGRTIQLEPTKAAVMAGLEELASTETKTVSKELALAETPPTKKLSDLNSLGIAERVGFGESYYAHSIPNRIHNVAITAARIDDTIIPPGAEFSFNKTLGDVSAATGYRSAYVIKNGKTELGDGGGVCQVSTTVFRAVLDAGLKVTKRLPHSYRVSYYELDRKPGMDATVYAGDVDLRFINDTPNHLLLHTVTDDKNTYMYVELYGTSDGRRTEIVDHKTWDARPAPPAQYFPDPTLPVGKLVQIDWAASGIRASFTNVIYDKNNAEIRRDTYTSNYKPWSAKYLQGVDPNAAPAQ